MTEKHNTVYFIGAGPGDPKYLTLEGKKALERCAVVYAVETYRETYALLLQGKDIRDPFERFFNEITDDIREDLLLGNVGVLVPGDFAVFSPFLPLVEHFEGRSRVVAGVGTLNASAALLKRTLIMPEVSRSVILTSPKHLENEAGAQELERLAKTAGTLVLFMNNRPLEQLSAELLQGFSHDTPVAIVSRAGMVGEKIYSATLSTIAGVVGSDDIFGLESGDPSLALVLVGAALTARSDPASWDRRKESFWDRRRKGRSRELKSGKKGQCEGRERNEA
jgi:precorrin-4/cobalt-precorrin-4 C11-methyltransferase